MDDTGIDDVLKMYLSGNKLATPGRIKKMKSVIAQHLSDAGNFTPSWEDAEKIMLGPARGELDAIWSAVKSQSVKPRWPGKIDLTTIDGVASALKQRMGGGKLSGKPWNSRYFDLGSDQRIRISDHTAVTRRSLNNSGELIVNYGNKGMEFSGPSGDLVIPYGDPRLSSRDGLQQIIDLFDGVD